MSRAWGTLPFPSPQDNDGVAGPVPVTEIRTVTANGYWIALPS